MCICAACVLYVVSRRGQSEQMAPLQGMALRVLWGTPETGVFSAILTLFLLFLSVLCPSAHLPTGRSGQLTRNCQWPSRAQLCSEAVNLSAASLTPADLKHASSFAQMLSMKFPMG